MATSMQVGLWAAQKLATDRRNNIAGWWDVEGCIDIPLLTAALREVLAHGSGLLTNFLQAEQGLDARTRPPGGIRPEAHDVSGEPDAAKAAHGVLADVVGRTFDLEHDTLFRFAVVRIAPDRCLFLVVVHPIVIDAVGLITLARRIADTYSELAAGHAPGSWPDAVAAHDRYRASARFAEDARFWRDYLTDAPAVARLPAGVGALDSCAPAQEPPGRARIGAAVGVHSCAVRVSSTEALQWARVGADLGVPLTTVLTSAVAAFLRHLRGTADFMFSLVVNNRVGTARVNFLPDVGSCASGRPSRTSPGAASRPSTSRRSPCCTRGGTVD